MDKTILKKKEMTRFMRLLKKSVLMVFISYSFIVQSYAFLPNEQRKIQVRPQHDKEMIVLVHGLMRTSLSMWPLKLFLHRQGYHVYSYSYPSAKYSIHEHGVYLNQFLKELSAKNPGIKIHFITHSLGGIITREALAMFSKEQLKNIGYLIMLAPPNQGSKLAKLSTQMFPTLTSPIKPLAELSSDYRAYVHHVPVPNIKMGIIAGQHDAKVRPFEARLQGQEAPMVVNSNHTFIMNNTKTKELIMHFLQKGTFAAY